MKAMAHNCKLSLSERSIGVGGHRRRRQRTTWRILSGIVLLAMITGFNTCIVPLKKLAQGARDIVAVYLMTTVASRTSTFRQPLPNPKQFDQEWINGRIPKVIWMFWDSGWPAPSHHAQLARTSFAFTNPTYEIRALNQHQAEMMTNRSYYIPNSTWSTLTVQTQSDIYRTMLLYHYGGIWVDASLFCNMPLDTWLPDATLDSTDLYTFQRTSDLAVKEIRMNLRPWITSWFLVAPPHAATVTLLFEKIIANASQHWRYTSEYYWWHRAVAALSAEHTIVRDNILNHMGDSAPSHCRALGWERIAPVIKRFANEEMMTVLPTAMRCCSYQPQQQQQKYRYYDHQQWRRFCGKYRCKGTVAEWDAFCQTNWTCEAHAANKPGAEYAVHALYGEHAASRIKDYFFGAIR